MEAIEGNKKPGEYLPVGNPQPQKPNPPPREKVGAGEIKRHCFLPRSETRGRGRLHCCRKRRDMPVPRCDEGKEEEGRDKESAECGCENPP